MNSENENKAFQIQDRKTKSPHNIKIAEMSQIPVKRKSPTVTYSGKKRKNLRFSFRRLIMPLFSLFLAFCLLSFYTEGKLAGKMPDLAQSAAEKHLLEIVNREVGNMAKEGLLSYDSMVSVIRSASGQAVYLEVNTEKLNQIKSLLVERIDRALEENKKIKLSIPFGSISGWNLFSGYGIPVKMKIHPIGMTEGEIRTELQDCGINQTRHLIQVEIYARLLIVLPGGNTRAETRVTLPLGERVLVGDVPEIFLENISKS